MQGGLLSHIMVSTSVHPADPVMLLSYPFQFLTDSVLYLRNRVEIPQSLNIFSRNMKGKVWQQRIANGIGTRQNRRNPSKCSVRRNELEQDRSGK